MFLTEKKLFPRNFSRVTFKMVAASDRRVMMVRKTGSWLGAGCGPIDDRRAGTTLSAPKIHMILNG